MATQATTEARIKQLHTEVSEMKSEMNDQLERLNDLVAQSLQSRAEAGEEDLEDKPEEQKPETLSSKADSLINTYTLWAAGAGVIPLPFLDVVGIAYVQGRMLDELYKNYYKADPLRPDEPTGFSKKFNKNLVISILGSFGPEYLFAGALASAMKFIPVIGSLPAGGAISVIGGLSTYVVGRLVKEDLEEGLTPEAIVDSLRALNMRDPRVQRIVKQGRRFLDTRKATPAKAEA